MSASQTRNPVLKELARLRAENPWWRPQDHLGWAIKPYAAKLTAALIEPVADALVSGEAVTLYMWCAALPVPAIRALLSRWPERPRDWRFFVAAMVEGATDAQLSRRWRAALATLKTLENDAKAEDFARLARKSDVVRALQRWAPKAPWHHVMTVLAVEGSEASAAALGPFFERAFGGDDLALDHANGLRDSLVASAALRPQVDRVAAAVRARAERSELPIWLRAVGLELPPERVRVVATTSASVENEYRKLQSLGVQLRLTGWSAEWAVLVVEDERLDSMVKWKNGALELDYLDFGPLSLVTLPAWLADATEVINGSWAAATVTAPELTDEQRARIARWLTP